MQYVDFYGHKVSKLICGDNPFNGHTYIESYVSKPEMLHYHTEEKIMEALHKMEELGINTILPLADPYMIRILQHYRYNGGKMNIIFQTFSPDTVSLERARISRANMMSVDPIGIYLSGTYTDCRFETNKNYEIAGMLALFKETGVKVGIGTHRPDFIEHVEKSNWDPDFYFACMYNARRNREGEESGFITGKGKGHITFYPEDRAIMLDTLKKIEKPVIAFKIFAGGQMLVDKTAEERHDLIKDAYDTIFNTLKPNDFAAMGIFQKHHDQLTENVSVFNEWASEQK